jgi:hypothetical protein
MNVRALATSLTKHGWTLRQIWRQGNVAVYEQSKPTVRTIAHEVIVIGISKPHFLDAGGFDLVERYPADEDWGTSGWTFRDLEAANRKVESLLDPFSLQSRAKILGILIAAEGEDSGSHPKTLPRAAVTQNLRS